MHSLKECKQILWIKAYLLEKSISVRALDLVGAGLLKHGTWLKFCHSSK